jgi:transcriptional regulator with XRE-family HTH domain
MRLKRLREDCELTQEQLAKRSGVSHGYLARLEIGMHDPSMSTLVKLAKALKVTVAKLVE